jgi:hypothetical protein
MARKVRHPYQILDISELVVDRDYCFVCSTSKELLVKRRTFKGFIQDSWLTASRRGYSLSTISKQLLKIDIFFDTSVANESFFTIHNDGWCYDNKTVNNPTIIYWYEDENGWDNLTAFIGGVCEPKKHHYIVCSRLD